MNNTFSVWPKSIFANQNQPINAFLQNDKDLNQDDRNPNRYPSGIFRISINSNALDNQCLQIIHPNNQYSQITDLIIRFRKFFVTKSYDFYQSFPLKTSDPSLLLMNSTVAMFKEEMLADKLLGKRAMSQLCFRAKDVEDYLYSFNMVGISADICYLDEAFNDTIKFLENSGISLDSLYVVLNSNDDLLVQSTKKFFPKDHIYYLENDNDKYNVRWKFGSFSLQGIGLTIIGKIKSGGNEDNKDDIMHPSFVPLGNIILVNNGYGLKYIDIGFGIECILSYFYEGKIFSIPFYSQQLTAIQEILPNGKDLLKNLLAFSCLYSENITPGKKKENYIAQKIQNKFFYLLYKLNKSPNDIEAILKQISNFYSEEEMKILSESFKLLASKFNPYIQNLSIKKSKVQKFVLNLLKDQLNHKEIKNKVFDTFGLPKKITGEIIMTVSTNPNIIKLNEINTKWAQADLTNVGQVHFGKGIIQADKIARTFLSYFVHQSQPRDHQVIKGASVLTKNDPTLLFINSGMAAIKPYFTGEISAPNPRLCNIQPCIRTNDIDDIGDMHHLSFFHMMGSWSIGDYYKKDAVNLAYDLLMNVLKFPKEKIYVTVFGGDEKLGIESDAESAKHWESVGVSKDHIVFLPAEDNFWGPAGDTGPCGPCTEIFYDMGDRFAKPYIPGRPETFDTKNRYVEIWNGGVFMQYFMHSDKTITPLKLKSVDTGSGLERMTMTMNGYNSVYDTDLLKPIYEQVENILPSLDIVKKRMLTDHIRTAVYLISEGVSPGNTGREYIVRKLIRKCIAEISKTDKDLQTIFNVLVSYTIQFLSESYPHFKGNEKAIEAIVLTEVTETSKVIKHGLELVKKNKPKEGNVFSPEIAHFLVTSRGLPFEILDHTLRDQGLVLDLEAYGKLDQEHKQASKATEDNSTHVSFSTAIQEHLRALSNTEFVGYHQDKASSNVSMLIQKQSLTEEINYNDPFYFAVSTTPFYAEGGGQCGDKGRGYSDTCEIEILDTKTINGIYLHEAKLKSGFLRKNETIHLEVNLDHRAAVKRNHSATHLLHYALCQVIGNTALQQGSLVEPTRLRFDFKSSSSLSDDQIQTIEKIVNDLIIKNLPIEISETSYETAKKSGAMAMFGEKYKEQVRVIKMGSSVELCGGTHAGRTGDLGLFLIQSEKSIAKGIRRIIALTGPEALNSVWARSKLLKQIAENLNAQPEDLLRKSEQVKKQAENKVSSSNIEKLQYKQLKKIALDKDKDLWIVSASEVFDLKQVQTKIFAENPSCEGVIFMIETTKGLNLRCLAKDQSRIDAGKFVKQIMTSFQGKGGGNQQLAQCTLQTSKEELLSHLTSDFVKSKL